MVILRITLLCVLMELAVAWLLPARTPLSEQLMARGIAILCLGLVLAPLPLPGEPARCRRLCLWALLCGAALVPGTQWLTRDLQQTAVLAGGAALLVFFFGSLCSRLTSLLGDRRHAYRITCGILALSLTLPVWAGPLVVLQGARKWLVDAVVACSPASYLASLTEIDYLRSQWWYQHAPYGSLRFDYPDPTTGTVILLSGAILLMITVADALPSRKKATALTGIATATEIES